MPAIIVDLTPSEAVELHSAVCERNRALEQHCAAHPQDEEARQQLFAACEMSSKLGAAMRRAFPA